MFIPLLVSSLERCGKKRDVQKWTSLSICCLCGKPRYNSALKHIITNILLHIMLVICILCNIIYYGMSHLTWAKKQSPRDWATSQVTEALAAKLTVSFNGTLPIYSWFTHEKMWFSIVILVYRYFFEPWISFQCHWVKRFPISDDPPNRLSKQPG